MPTPYERQWTRLVVICSLLRNNRTGITCAKIAEHLARHEQETASVKTIQRDIARLKCDFNAPIEFCHSENSYGFISDFELPALELGRTPVAPAQMANAVARQVLPPNLVASLDVMDETIRAASPAGALANPELLHAIMVAGGRNVELNKDVCDAVFHAWQESRRIALLQRTEDGSTEELLAEPHAIFFTEGAWYVRARCLDRTSGTALPRNAWRSLPLHRLGLCAGRGRLGDAFARDPAVQAELRKGRLFNYHNIRNVRVTCDARRFPKVAQYIRERTWFPDQRIAANAAGELELSVPEASLPQMAAWVLQFGGAAVAREPAGLVAEVRGAVKRLAAAHNAEAAAPA